MNRSSCVGLMLISALAASAQDSGPGIQDNGFLVEEAYNQDSGVVQHINSFTRIWNTGDWAYSFTQEWPAPHHSRHQLSYTLAAIRSDSRIGMGDTILNYRYQLVGNSDTHLAFAPRLSLLLPTGDSNYGHGLGAIGLQTNLPVSLVLLPKLISHWNAGSTFIPHAQDSIHDHASSVGYNFGQSFVWLTRPRFNVMMETVYSCSQTVVGPRHTQWDRSAYLNPGVRWAYNFKSGLQIVPGIGVPVGVGPSSGDHGILVYLSFEHPFVRQHLNAKR